MRTKPHTYYARDHKGWGNAISVTDWQAGKIHGHLKRTPRVGDRIVFEMKSGREQVAVVTEVELQFDPPDMFFATVCLEGEDCPLQSADLRPGSMSLKGWSDGW